MRKCLSFIVVVLNLLFLSSCKKDPPEEFSGRIEIEIAAMNTNKVEFLEDFNGIKKGILPPSLYADLDAHYFTIISGENHYGIMKPSQSVLIQMLKQDAASGDVLVEYDFNINNMKEKVLMTKSNMIIRFGVYPVETVNSYHFTAYKSGNGDMQILTVERN